MNGSRDEEVPSDSSLFLRALEELDRERAVDVVEDATRRHVLHELDPKEGPVALSELAERVANPDVRGGASVAAQSHHAGPVGIGPADRLAVQLHHVHLPKLDDCGLVEYDQREKTVSANTSP